MAKAVKPKTEAKTPAAQTAPAPKPAVARPGSGADPAIEALTQGLAALQGKQWAQAVEHFERAVQESDVPEVKDRAKQFLAISRQQAQAGAPKTAKGEELDPFLLAVYEKNRGNHKEALEMSRKGGLDQKDERFAYLAASIHALENRLDEAAQALAKAVELNPRNRIHAFHDPDFAELRKNRDHRALFGLS